MYVLSNNQITEIEETSFSKLSLREDDMEEILKKNINILCDDEESMLIIGQQVKNSAMGRSDLTAVDNFGNIVLIELKRDKSDIIQRKEAFEFQAIRYAASYATIKSTDELIQLIYAPYVEKNRNEFVFEGSSNLTSSEIAKRKLNDFIEKNEITSFNARQRIILVATDFDEQTLSAVAWLNSNNVDISCFRLCPFNYNGTIILNVVKVLPTPSYDDFYVPIAGSSLLSSKTKHFKRGSLPKIDYLLEKNAVQAGDIIVAKGTSYEAVLRSDGDVDVEGEKDSQSLQKWLKNIYGWQAVETYKYTIHKKTGKTLSLIRKELLEAESKERIEPDADPDNNG